MNWIKKKCFSDNKKVPDDAPSENILNKWRSSIRWTNSWNWSFAERLVYPCKECNFVSSWNDGLFIHMSSVHREISAKYKEAYRTTENYWKRGKWSSSYQSYLDSMLVVEECSLSELETEKEYDRILDARKLALGKYYKDNPPWTKVRI